MSAHIHTYTYMHTHIQNAHVKRTQARLERRRGSERARSRCRPRKLCTSFSFAVPPRTLAKNKKHRFSHRMCSNQPHLAPPLQGLHCTHVLQHQYPSSGAAEPQYASTQESKPENDQSDCSLEMKGQWRTTNPCKQPITQITTARRPDNTCSSALVRSQSNNFMANPRRELRSRYFEIGSHFHHFPAVTLCVYPSLGMWTRWHREHTKGIKSIKFIRKHISRGMRFGSCTQELTWGRRSSLQYYTDFNKTKTSSTRYHVLDLTQ